MLFVVLAAARQTGAVMLCRSLSDDRGWPVRVDAAAPTPPPVPAERLCPEDPLRHRGIAPADADVDHRVTRCVYLMSR